MPSEATAMRAGFTACGVSVKVDASSLLGSERVAALLANQLLPILSAGLPLAVCVSRLGKPGLAEARLARLMDLCRELARDLGPVSGQLELAIDGDVASPLAIVRLVDDKLGRVPLHLGISKHRLKPAKTEAAEAANRRFWEEITAPEAASLHTILATDVVAASPLLVAEHATAVEPGSGLLIPSGSAWAPATIDLSEYTRRGELDHVALEPALERAMDHADSLHELIEWPTPAMRQDAWLNRRLSVMLTGIGDWLAQAGHDPSCPAVLAMLERLLRWVLTVLKARSRSSVTAAEPLPAIAHNDPCRGLRAGPLRDDWRNRWRRAVQDHALRHRNLLAMSPWALHPRQPAFEPRYLNLLPLLRHAHVVSLRRGAGAPIVDATKFRDLHQRLHAVLQQRAAAHQIAQEI